MDFSTGERRSRQTLTKCVRAVDDEEKAGKASSMPHRGFGIDFEGVFHGNLI